MVELNKINDVEGYNVYGHPNCADSCWNLKQRTPTQAKVLYLHCSKTGHKSLIDSSRQILHTYFENYTRTDGWYLLGSDLPRLDKRRLNKSANWSTFQMVMRNRKGMLVGLGRKTMSKTPHTAEWTILHWKYEKHIWERDSKWGF